MKINSLSILSLALASLGGYADCGFSRYPSRAQKRECLLKDCNNLTDHNGGFCCAEHSRKYKLNNK